MNLAGALLILAALAVCACLLRRRLAREAHRRECAFPPHAEIRPWALPAEVRRRGFDGMREAIPPTDAELRRARKLTRIPRRSPQLPQPKDHTDS